MSFRRLPRMRITAYLNLLLGAGALHLAADPLPPLLVSPGINALNIATLPTLRVKLLDSNSGNLTVRALYLGSCQ